VRCRYQSKLFSAWSPAGSRGQYKLTRMAARITYGYADSLEILGAEPIWTRWKILVSSRIIPLILVQYPCVERSLRRVTWNSQYTWSAKIRSHDIGLVLPPIGQSPVPVPLPLN
jgi:hypothetical protein